MTWTEYFKRIFLELAGTEYATLYPFAILLLASMSAAFFGAVAVTPFEALRIRSVAAVDGPTGFIGSLAKVQLYQSIHTVTCNRYTEEGQFMHTQPLWATLKPCISLYIVLPSPLCPPILCRSRSRTS